MKIRVADDFAVKAGKAGIAIWIAVFGNALCVAQSISGLNKDSLRHALASMPDDTSKALVFLTMGQQYENNAPDSAAYFYNQSKALSTKIHYPAGIVHYINNYTAVLNMQGKFDESLRLHQEAAALCKQYGLKDLYIKSLVNIGVVHQYKQDYQQAINYYLKALPALEEKGDAQILSVVYGNLCGAYRGLELYDKAYEYAAKELAAATKNKDLTYKASAYNNMANVLKNMGKQKEAVRYLQQAYALGKKLDDINIQETSLINMGDMFNETDEPEKAMTVFMQALPLVDALKDVYGKSTMLHGMSYSLFLQKKYDQAEKQTNDALIYAKEHDQTDTYKMLLLLMSDIKIATGDIDGSEQLRSKYDSLSIALADEDLLKNIKVMESKYEVEKKQSQLLRQSLLLEQKNKETLRQRILISIFIGCIGVLCFILFFIYRYYRQKQQLNKKEMQALQAEQENIRLKSTIDGQLQERRRISREMHDDIGSGLTSVLFLSRSVQGQDVVTSRLKNLAQDLVQKMNEIIWTMNHEQDTLENLIAYMRKQIAETLDNAGIAYQFTVTEALPELPVSQEFRRNIYLVSKEAVHNIIKHSNATMAEINITLDNTLKIVISDNGKGFHQNSNASFGNGLKNMQQRMEQLNGNFQITTGNGTTVIFEAPLPV